MSDVQRNEKEHVSRRQAAERLVDLAYALTTGGRLELSGKDAKGKPIQLSIDCPAFEEAKAEGS